MPEPQQPDPPGTRYELVITAEAEVTRPDPDPED